MCTYRSRYTEGGGETWTTKRTQRKGHTKATKDVRGGVSRSTTRRRRQRLVGRVHRLDLQFTLRSFGIDRSKLASNERSITLFCIHGVCVYHAFVKIIKVTTKTTTSSTMTGCCIIENYFHISSSSSSSSYIQNVGSKILSRKIPCWMTEIGRDTFALETGIIHSHRSVS